MVTASVGAFLRDLAQHGRQHFTTADAVAAHGGSVATVRGALRRLRDRGEIASPHKGFYVLVPPEYRRLGCLPAEQFIPQLMQLLGEHYYVGLLSAAELHGAAHQRPQSFQVMVRTNRRPIACGQVRVQFVARKDLAQTPTVERNTPRGVLRVASPEAVALELVGYFDRCGGLDQVASVLAELGEILDPQQLVAAAALCPMVWVQRLGYLLDLCGNTKIADELARYVQAHVLASAPLVAAKTTAGAKHSDRWHLAVNATVEPDQ